MMSSAVKGEPSDHFAPLAQLDGPGLEVRGGGDALRQLHLDGGAVRPEAGEHVVDHAVDAVEVRGPQEAAAPDAAVLADFVGRNDQRILRQALLDRRQLAGLHQVGQHGRFLVLTLSKAGKNTDQKKDQKQNPCSFHKHLLISWFVSGSPHDHPLKKINHITLNTLDLITDDVNTHRGLDTSCVLGGF